MIFGLGPEYSSPEIEPFTRAYMQNMQLANIARTSYYALRGQTVDDYEIPIEPYIADSRELLADQTTDPKAILLFAMMRAVEASERLRTDWQSALEMKMLESGVPLVQQLHAILAHAKAEWSNGMSHTERLVVRTIREFCEQRAEQLAQAIAAPNN